VRNQRLLFATFVTRVWTELLIHNLIMRTRGFKKAYSRLEKTQTRHGQPRRDDERIALEAIEWAAIFYPARVMCLQRSFVTARILRNCGIAANVAIGYRMAPFFSHAWVEVGDRVINDERSYRRQLNILLRNTPSDVALSSKTTLTNGSTVSKNKREKRI
jgi:Transglutaminase-like superfamily